MCEDVYVSICVCCLSAVTHTQKTNICTHARLHAQVKDKHASNGVNVNTGGSTRSAIEGSLLYRVEVLEEAMEVLLASQEVGVMILK